MVGVNRISAETQSFGRASRPSVQISSTEPGGAPELPRAWVIGAILASFDAIGRSFVTFVALIAAAAAPERIAIHLLHFDWRYLPLTYCITFVMGCGLWGAIIQFTLDSAKGAAVDFGSCVIAGLVNLLPTLILVARPFVGITVAMLLIVAPPLIRESHWPIYLSQEDVHTFVRIGWFAVPSSILIALRWFVAPAAAMAESLSIRDSVARSKALTKRHVSGFFLAALILIALSLMLGSLMEPLWGMPPEALPEFLIGNWLAPLIVTALTASVATSLYLALVLAEDDATKLTENPA